jgi:hypothetical protein
MSVLEDSARKSSAALDDGRSKSDWVTRGFEAFRRGTFGNAGHNLFVSRAGVLQRIHQYDLNRDGYVELLFCNSQEHLETPPAFIYQWENGAFRCEHLPTQGAGCVTAADLNCDGKPELIVGNWYDGISFDLNSVVYFGSDGRWGEHAAQYLPAYQCMAVAAGDFNGDGRADIALQCATFLRIFYQTELAIEPQKYLDLPIKGDQLDAFDLDGDGCAELIIRFKTGEVRIYWGAKGEGLHPERFTQVAAGTIPEPAADAPVNMLEWIDAPRPLVKVVSLAGKPSIFVARDETVLFYPVAPDRQIGQPLKIECPNAFSVAIADLDNDGFDDLIFASRNLQGGAEVSWIYWGSHKGYDVSSRTPLPSSNACDITVGDFDGDGDPEIAICQAFKDDTFTTPAVLYKLSERRAAFWQQVEAHDARRVLTLSNGGSRKSDSLFVMNRHGRNKRGDIDAAIYLGGPDGFRADRRILLPGWGSTVAVCADFNDDGWPDVAMANTSENSVDDDPGSYIYLNSAKGFELGKPATILPTKRAHGIACADLDRDGYLDLVFVGFQNDEVLIFRGLPDGGFDIDNPQRIKLEIDGKKCSEQRFIYLADLTGDGWLDLILPMIDKDFSLVLFGGPGGFSIDRSRKFNVRRACCARAADLDGDGYLDLIFGGHIASATGPHDSFAYIYWNGPDGLREDRRTLLPAEAINSISIADFNNDGHLDLFIGSYHDGRKRRDIDSYIYWNQGGRGFSASNFTRLFNHSASGDFAADFNEDGWVDLAVANHKTYGDHLGQSKVWWNGPKGFNEERVTLLPTAGPHGMVCPGPGNVMDRGAEEYYISELHQLPEGQQASRISWEAALMPKTWVRAQMRFASTREGLTNAEWQGPTGAGGWYENGDALKPAKLPWLQYRLALGATNSGGTPRITSVTVEATRS